MLASQAIRFSDFNYKYVSTSILHANHSVCIICMQEQTLSFLPAWRIDARKQLDLLTHPLCSGWKSLQNRNTSQKFWSIQHPWASFNILIILYHQYSPVTCHMVPNLLSLGPYWSHLASLLTYLLIRHVLIIKDPHAIWTGAYLHRPAGASMAAFKRAYPSPCWEKPLGCF